MSSKSLLKKIISLADDKKAENIVALDVSKITSLSEYFVVCSASNLIQVKAIADNIKENISENPWKTCLLYTSPSPRDSRVSRMPSSA